MIPQPTPDPEIPGTPYNDYGYLRISQGKKNTPTYINAQYAYHIQKTQKRTIIINATKYFIQLPDMLFKIPYLTINNKYKLFINYDDNNNFEARFITNKQHKQYSILLNTCTPFFGNSNRHKVCLGTELEKFYWHNTFNSIKELSQQLIHHYWSTPFDDSYNYFESTMEKEECMYLWEKNTKLNKTFDIPYMQGKIITVPTSQII